MNIVAVLGVCKSQTLDALDVVRGSYDTGMNIFPKNKPYYRQQV